VDVIADNQTEATIAKLRRGEATDAIRDEVSAALLSSMQTIIAELGEMKKSLWSAQTLKDLVDERHNILCSACPARQYANLQSALAAQKKQEKKQEDKPSWLQILLSSESIRYFILILVLVWAVIYIKTGPEGVDAVKGGVAHTVTGGQVK
jgi:hypothetical protein